MKNLSLIVLIALAPTYVFADTSVHLRVEGPSATLYAQTLAVTACPVTDNPATTTVSAKCALEQAGLAPEWSNFGGDDWFLSAAGGVSQDFANNLYWGWWSDFTYGQVALNKHEVVSDESLIVALGVLPLRIAAPDSTTVGATTTLKVEEFGFDAGFNGVWNPSVDADVTIVDTHQQTGADGTVEFVPASTDTLLVSASKSGFIAATLVLEPEPAAAVASTTATTTPAVDTGSVAGGGGGGGGSGGASATVQATFSVPRALSYLLSKQRSDGSYGSLFLSDWAAIALAAGEMGNAALRDYLRAAPALASVTDYERHAMALMASGINPYTGTAIDYISPIVAKFDGTQIGDANLDNDDIFALIPLLHAGYSDRDAIIKKTVAFILSEQGADGSWDASVDMTAAAVQALAEVDSLPGVSDALSQAKSYLRAHQQPDGGFSNSFSTSWALQAAAALGEQTSAWALGGRTGVDYLASLQQDDGGIEPVSASEQNRVWATTYAVPGALGKTWSEILHSFDKPAASAGTPAGAVLGAASSTLEAAASATTTPVVATTTVAAEVVQIASVVAPARTRPLAVNQVTPVVAPLPVAEVPVAAESVLPKGFFARLWHAVVGFFTYWL
ncbi:MAG: prenyltransferase/squalene oxidase repeat-containing protein [Candidatus Paceibacterota bacterium]